MLRKTTEKERIVIQSYILSSVLFITLYIVIFKAMSTIGYSTILPNMLSSVLHLSFAIGLALLLKHFTCWYNSLTDEHDRHGAIILTMLMLTLFWFYLAVAFQLPLAIAIVVVFLCMCTFPLCAVLPPIIGMYDLSRYYYSDDGKIEGYNWNAEKQTCKTTVRIGYGYAFCAEENVIELSDGSLRLSDGTILKKRVIFD